MYYKLGFFIISPAFGEDSIYSLETYFTRQTNHARQRDGQMASGLTDAELFLLNVMRIGRNFNDKASYNPKQIASQCRDKYGEDPNDIAQRLVSKEYLTTKRKKDIKYWISNLPKTYNALGQHGFNVGNEKRIIRRNVFRLTE